LTKQHWTARQRRYMEIKADPMEMRTQQEIAKELGVKRQTLWNWEQIEGFWGEVNDIIHEHGDKGLSSVIQAVHRKATRGDMNAARLYLQWLGELVEKQEQKHSFDSGDLTVNFITDGENAEEG